MSSKTFPTAYHKCGAGPLNILEEDSHTKEMSMLSMKSMTRISTTRPTTDLTTKAFQTIQNLVTLNPLTWTSQPTSSNDPNTKQTSESQLTMKYTSMTTEPPSSTSKPGTPSTKLTTYTYHDDSTSESNLSNSTGAKINNSNSTRRKVLILNLVWCASGALILSLLIIICAVLCQGRTSKKACRATPSLKSVRKITNAPDNPSSSKPMRYKSRYASSRSQPSIVGHSSSHNAKPNQLPLYAIVHQTNSDDENSLDTKAADAPGVEEYEDIDLPENYLFEPFKERTQKSKSKILGAKAIKTTILDEYEDVELHVAAQDDLEESTMNSKLNFPRSEAMHYKDSSITLGQSLFYAIVHQSNSSDEDVSNISTKPTAKYENIDFPSKPTDLSSSSQMHKSNQKLKVEAITGDNNSSDSSELVDNIIYVSSGP